MGLTPQEKEGKFRDFLKDKTVFIVDCNTSSGARLMKSMVELGAKTINVKSFKNYDEAVTAFEKQKPTVVLSDYKLGKRTGFELLQEVKKYHDEHKESLFVLVTSNSSQSLVAQAAEEDVDAYVLRPYTMESFRDIVVNAAYQKLYPSDYIKKVDEGKAMLFAGKAKESMAIFKQATTMHPKPALAYFYHAQAEKMENLLSQAEGNFKKGLTFNTIHYKCLTGLFDLLYDLKRFKDAYEVVKTIAKYFPANPNRLTQVVRLAIMTENYADIENFYQLFIDIEVRTDELTNAICSAMGILGKYYLMKGSPDKALAVFQNLKNSIAGRIRFLQYICETLVIYGQGAMAGEFQKRFTADEFKTPEYAICSFLAEQHKMDDLRAIKEATTLMDKKMYSYAALYVLAERYYKVKKEKEAKSIVDEGSFKFADKKWLFEKLVKNATEKAKPPTKTAEDDEDAA